MESEIDVELFGLIERLQQMQEHSELLATRHHDLREQLRAAERKLRELHQRILEEDNDIGGEG